jgi:type III secretion protein L
MAVWITHGSGAVGIDDGVIRARDFAHLVDAAALVQEAARERDRVVAEARAQADALLEAAREEASSLVAEAQSSFEQAYKTGLDRGLHDAATQWAGQALDAAGATRRSLYRQSERLSNLVSMAVERVIDQEDRAALFRRSLRTIVKLVKNVPVLTMRVHELDRDHAQRAVETVLKQSRSSMSIEVLSDPALLPGGCRFESDDGVVDASLDTQLEALRRAVQRAAHHIAPPAPEPELEPAEAIDGEQALAVDEAH